MKRCNTLDRLFVTKRKSNIIIAENGTTTVVSFAATNVSDTCLGFRVICEIVTYRNSVESVCITQFQFLKE